MKSENRKFAAAIHNAFPSIRKEIQGLRKAAKDKDDRIKSLQQRLGEARTKAREESAENIRLNQVIERFSAKCLALEKRIDELTIQEQP